MARSPRSPAAAPTMALPHLTVLQAQRPTLGLMFIGDPHVWSRKPGRRREASYSQTILGKLRWAAERANATHHWPVILGDLLHEATDNDLAMLSELMSVLKMFDRTPLVLVGNHDKNQTRLTPGTGLHLLDQAGVIHTVLNNGPFARVVVDGEQGPTRVLIGGTPYGDAIPVSLAPWVKTPLTPNTREGLQAALQVDWVVWITHEDLAFDHSYPNAVALHPIIGVDMAVNGHMHATQKPIFVGGTAWYNPGNIARNTIDLLHHIPRVWSWTPGPQCIPGADGVDVPALVGWDIPHVPGPEALSFEGRITAAAEKTRVDIPSAQDEAGKAASMDDDETTVAQGAPTSRFVAMSQQDSHIQRSDDGVFLQEAIIEEFERLNPTTQVRGIVEQLLGQALEQHRSKP